MKFEMRKTALQNKPTLNSFGSNGKQTAEQLLIYQASLTLFYSFFLSQFWTSSKCLLALETNTNNQEVKKKSIYLDLSPSCSTLSVLLNFRNTCTRIYKDQ